MSYDVLQQVQREIGEWAQEQFGDNPSHNPRYEGVKLFSIPPFLGMVEEIGELAAPQCKRHQGRKFLDEAEYQAAIRDGLADLLIFACDFARREGVNLSDTLRETWDKVKARRQATWEADKAKDGTYKPQSEIDTVPEGKISAEAVRSSSIPVPPVRGSSRSYDRLCEGGCGKAVHRTNTLGLCPDCAAIERAKKAQDDGVQHGE